MGKTIYRRPSAHGLVYFVHFEGQRLEVAESFALAMQKQGKAKIKTLETA